MVFHHRIHVKSSGNLESCNVIMTRKYNRFEDDILTPNCDSILSFKHSMVIVGI